jgi:hypothetical protein
MQMTRRGILALALATLVLLLGASRVLAGKGGGKKPPSDPPADPAIALLDDNDNKPSSLVVMNEDGSNVTELLTAGDAGGALGAPDWSPDGTRLVFTIGPRDAAVIHSMDVDGTGLTQLHARNGSGPTWVRWSPGAMPDGLERIAYTDQVVLTDGSLGPEHLFLVGTDGSDPVDTGKASGSLSWSPDAARIAVSRRANGIRVHRFGVDSGGELVLADSPRYDLDADVTRVAWSKTDNNALAVTVNFPGNGFEIWRIDLRDAVADGTNSDGTPLFSLTTHTVLAASPSLGCDWSSDDSELIFGYGQKKPSGGLRNWGCWILGVDPYAAPVLFYRNGYSPAWRR